MTVGNMVGINAAGRALALATACGAVVVLAACGTPVTPFSPGSSVSEIARVFLAAAGTWDRNKDGVGTCDEWMA